MTYREYFNAVLNANISDEMNEASVEFLSKMDSRNEKRKTTMTKDKAKAIDHREAVLAFLKENCSDLYETTSGKLQRYHATLGDYKFDLLMDQHIVSRTSARTFDHKAVKNVDESYNEYEFFIMTDVAPWSEHLEKQAAKQAKRDAKGKKKKNVDDLM